MHSLNTMILDIAPQIRCILRTEHERRRFKSEQMSLDNLWSHKRRTRGQAKEEQEGRKRYFENKIDGDIVLKTWLELSCTEDTGDNWHERE